MILSYVLMIYNPTVLWSVAENLRQHYPAAWPSKSGCPPRARHPRLFEEISPRARDILDFSKKSAPAHEVRRLYTHVCIYTEITITNAGHV